MKKIISVTIVFIFITFWGNAQVISPDLRDETIFGLKAGTNYSNVYDTKGNEFNTSAIYGWVAGGFLCIPLGTFIGIQPEVLYSQKGFQTSVYYLGTTYSYVRTTSFYDIPIFFALKPGRRITLLAGPQYSYLIKQVDVYNNGNNVVEQMTRYENTNIRKNILCFVGGFDITYYHLVLCGRVGWDVQDNNGDGTAYAPRYKNVWGQLTLGYRFYK